MRGFVCSTIGGVLLFLTLHSNAQFTYVNPMPGSKMHNAETGIILRTGKIIDATSLRNDLVFVSGSLSGLHEVKVKSALDNKSILIQPSTVFRGGEVVTVKVSDGMHNADGSLIHGTTFTFETHPEWTSEQKEKIAEAKRQERIDEYGLQNYERMFGGYGQGYSPLLLCNNLPAFKIVSTPGAYCDEPVFYRNFRIANPITCFTETILSSSGDSIYSDQNNDAGNDFKINDNGYLTYYNTLDSSFHMLDSSYNLVKTLAMGNGYQADEHECRVYPDGTTLLLCYDTQIMDMTAYGGQPDASVTGLVIQELDADGNVIFEWSSWDHFQITDTDDNINLTIGSVDLIHGNSLDLDGDGNLLLSSRHLDEITKIDLSTGDIIWRMGGKNNQFTFINDPSIPLPFSFQHHFRRVPNGHYTMFDNGNYQSPDVSIAKEWTIDESNKVATLVWSYQHPQVNGVNVVSGAMGSVEILPNGNRFIDWGFRKNLNAGGIPNFTEVDSFGNIVWEFWFKDSTYISYRAFKKPWDRCNLIDAASLVSDSITLSSAKLHWSDNSKISGFILQYKKCSETTWTSVPLDTNIYKLESLQVNTCYNWRVESICSIYNDSSYTEVQQFNTHNPLNVPQLSNEGNYFVFYPNPATGQTEMRFTSVINSSADVTMYNILGSIMMHQTIYAHAGKNSMNLDLREFSAGTYTVELRTTNATMIKKLIIH
ncbi:MAG: arylsulfotransferase family protein [Chitinophagales bacterium]